MNHQALMIKISVFSRFFAKGTKSQLFPASDDDDDDDDDDDNEEEEEKEKDDAHPAFDSMREIKYYFIDQKVISIKFFR